MHKYLKYLANCSLFLFTLSIFLFYYRASISICRYVRALKVRTSRKCALILSSCIHKLREKKLNDMNKNKKKQASPCNKCHSLSDRP